MPWRYQICIAKWLYSYREDLLKNLFKIVPRDCKKSTSVRLAWLTNFGAYKLPNEKNVWQWRSEIRAKTVKTRVLGSSLSSPLPSAAVLVSDYSARSRSFRSLCIVLYFFFLTGLINECVRDKHKIWTEVGVKENCFLHRFECAS